MVTLLLADDAQRRFDQCAPNTYRPGPFLGPAQNMAVTGLRRLGRGVAYVLDSPELAALRGQLAADWDPWPTRQERQRHART